MRSGPPTPGPGAGGPARRAGSTGAAVALIAAVAVGIVTAATAGTAGAEVPPPAPGTTSGRSLYLSQCAVCHGSDAEGTPRGPSLIGAGPAYVDYMVSTGRMPIDEPDEPVRRSEVGYTDEQVAAIVAYLERLDGTGPDIPAVDPGRGDLAEGGRIYRSSCAACHQWNGQGGALKNGQAPDLHPASPRQVGEAVRIGPGGGELPGGPIRPKMPVYDDELISDAELDSVVAYVTNLDDSEDPGGISLWHYGPLTEGAAAWVVGIGALLVVIRMVGRRQGSHGG